MAKDNEEDVISRAIQALQNGGVIIYPTDTLYGLGVDIKNDAAARRLFALKKRPENKPVPVLVDSIAMAKEYAFIDAKQEKVLGSLWPGPVTVILWKKNKISSLVASGGQTVGLRIPASQFCINLIHAFGGAISGTSANISGEQPSLALDPILVQFREHARYPDFVIDAGTLKSSPPSTVVDLTGHSPKILRVGPVTAGQLKMILGN
ncbi:MAG: threonylcarbamoyl-AMP synthase [Candidatus Spechtbacteria bacterium]|nr:threonylcarbamoyl-AMP synthase [Candidatus Spechtbacteria bacterium]